MISFVVPAHNEQACLARTLGAIHESAKLAGEPYEIIVVDDASTDATPEIARQYKARVVSVNHRQIAATRNSGARAARGERIFFVDADTTVNIRAIQAALRCLNSGAVGGGAATTISKEEVIPAYIRVIVLLSGVFAIATGFTGGAFMFCTREAFLATGGFNEKVYWSEEGGFALALKREGRFTILRQKVLTSGRRFRKTSALQLLLGGLRLCVSPVKMFTQRSSVEKIWYDSNRADDDTMPDSLAIRISNFIALVIILIMVTGPFWNFIPHAWTPPESVAGRTRLGIGIFLGHVGLAFWPVGFIVLKNLLRQKRLTNVPHSLALIAFCVWQGWVCTRIVIWFWSTLIQRLAG